MSTSRGSTGQRDMRLQTLDNDQSVHSHQTRKRTYYGSEKRKSGSRPSDPGDARVGEGQEVKDVQDNQENLDLKHRRRIYYGDEKRRSKSCPTRSDKEEHNLLRSDMTDEVKKMEVRRVGAEVVGNKQSVTTQCPRGREIPSIRPDTSRTALSNRRTPSRHHRPLLNSTPRSRTYGSSRPNASISEPRRSTTSVAHRASGSMAGQGIWKDESQDGDDSFRKHSRAEPTSTYQRVQAMRIRTPGPIFHNPFLDAQAFSSPNSSPTSPLTPATGNRLASHIKRDYASGNDLFTFSSSAQSVPRPISDRSLEGQNPFLNIIRRAAAYKHPPPLLSPPRLLPIPDLPSIQLSNTPVLSDGKRSPVPRSKTRRSVAKRSIVQNHLSTSHDSPSGTGDTANIGMSKYESGKKNSVGFHERGNPKEGVIADEETEVDEEEGGKFRYAWTANGWPDPFPDIVPANFKAAAPLSYRLRATAATRIKQSYPGPVLVPDSEDDVLRPDLLEPVWGDYALPDVEEEQPRFSEASRPPKLPQKTYARRRTHIYKVGLPDPVYDSQRQRMSPQPFGSYTGAKRKGSTTMWPDPDWQVPGYFTNIEVPCHPPRSCNGLWPNERDQGLLGGDSPPPTRLGPVTRSRSKRIPITKAFIPAPTPESSENEIAGGADAKAQRKKRRIRHARKRKRNNHADFPKLKMTRAQSWEARVITYLKKARHERSKKLPRLRKKHVPPILGYSLKPISSISWAIYKQLQQDHPDTANKPWSRGYFDHLVDAGRNARFDDSIRKQRRYTRQYSPEYPVRPLKMTQEDPQNNDRIDIFGSQSVTSRDPPRSHRHERVHTLPRLRFTDPNLPSPPPDQEQRRDTSSTLEADTPPERPQGFENTVLGFQFDFPSRRPSQRRSVLPFKPPPSPPPDFGTLNNDVIRISFSPSRSSSERPSEETRVDPAPGGSNQDNRSPITVLRSLAALAEASHTEIGDAGSRQTIAAECRNVPNPLPPQAKEAEATNPEKPVVGMFHQDTAEQTDPRTSTKEATLVSNPNINNSPSPIHEVTKDISSSVLFPFSEQPQNQRGSKPASAPHRDQLTTVPESSAKAISLSEPFRTSAILTTTASSSIAKRLSGMDITRLLLANRPDLSPFHPLTSANVLIDNQTFERESPSKRPKTSPPNGRRAQREAERSKRIAQKHRSEKQPQKTYTQTKLDFGKRAGGAQTVEAQKILSDARQTGQEPVLPPTKLRTPQPSQPISNTASISKPGSGTTFHSGAQADRTLEQRHPSASLIAANIGISRQHTATSSRQASQRYTPSQLQERYQRSSQAALSKPYKNPSRSTSQQPLQEAGSSHVTQEPQVGLRETHHKCIGTSQLHRSSPSLGAEPSPARSRVSDSVSDSQEASEMRASGRVGKSPSTSSALKASSSIHPQATGRKTSRPYTKLRTQAPSTNLTRWTAPSTPNDRNTDANRSSERPRWKTDN